MLRIHFTGTDLGRTRLADGPDLMWEVVNSVQLLQHREGSLIFGDWRRKVFSGAAGTKLTAVIRLLSTLAPQAAYFPDFLTPTQPGADLETAIDTVLTTPRRRLRSEISRLATHRQLPGWTARVARGEPEVLHRMGTAIRTYHHAVLEPHRDLINACVYDEYARIVRLALGAGTEALLNGLGPALSWEAPVLRAEYPLHREVRLEGRGLLLVPSAFCWHYPVTFADASLTPVLVYPLAHRPRWLQVRSGDTGLAALVGQTRTAVLESTVRGCTTSQLASRVGVSPATASRHASVLREARLITTSREGGAVVHTITPLGLELLNARP